MGPWGEQYKYKGSLTFRRASPQRSRVPDAFVVSSINDSLDHGQDGLQFPQDLIHEGNLFAALTTQDITRDCLDPIPFTHLAGPFLDDYKSFLGDKATFEIIQSFLRSSGPIEHTIRGSFFGRTRHVADPKHEVDSAESAMRFLATELAGSTWIMSNQKNEDGLYPMIKKEDEYDSDSESALDERSTTSIGRRVPVYVFSVDDKFKDTVRDRDHYGRSTIGKVGWKLRESNEARRLLPAS
ncbi:hypothetical protein I302_108068 [Kwoniella bestiolae CBS 10118]|uniref:Uncharacterized protein n=1 Tax=Kwoniella bestiolae CBS 10118 TaxID=1296100 RepID=A0A1B9FWR3_9TREE|nr:hypothetical protein I302_07566 [Kwoniella bestiolae CBS 10118]OCF23212.1 hypothetical protein I302_07566 [Kwoniella bestiolae CBS 10118]